MESKSAVDALSALAHEGRLTIFRALVRAGPDGLAAGKLGEVVGIGGSTLSNNLTVLTRAGLAASARDGRSIIYTADYGRMTDLLAFLLEDCCEGSPNVCAPLGDVIAKAMCCPPAGASMTLVGLTPADPAWSDFLSALTDSDLPVDDLTDAGQFFFVSEAGAYGGFALLGSHALLRSIVTPPSLRGTGEGRRMVEALCREAAEQGASTVWLLTTGAADFFASCGFDRTSRADAPNAIRTTKQFSGICPGSASLMHRSLAA